MISHLDFTYGPSSRNRMTEATDSSHKGARAALESFYYALNHRDGDAMRDVWAEHRLAQLNNPLGGILRGGSRAVELYERIFAGPVVLEVTFGDVVEYSGVDHVVFAGRETGDYALENGPATPIEIRTTRYLRFENGRWSQYHHHGSIDNPTALANYQQAIGRHPGD